MKSAVSGAYLAAAANDDGAGVDDRLAKQDVLGENGVLDAGDGRGEGLGAGGDHDGVGFIGGDEVLIYLLAKVDVDIELLEAGAQAADVHGQLTLADGEGCGAELTAQLILGLVHGDVVAALRCSLGSLKARGAGADDHDLLGGLDLVHGVLVLTTTRGLTKQVTSESM